MREELELRKLWLDHWHGMISRIEPAIGGDAGFPDTFLCWDTTDVLVEFKVVEPDGSFSLEPSQRLWHSKAVKHTNASLICCLDREGFWLFPSLELSLSKCEQSMSQIVAIKRAWASLRQPDLLLSLCRQAISHG